MVSNTVTLRNWPSSASVKFFAVSPRIGLPAALTTLTGTSTRLTLTRSCTSPRAAGAMRSSERRTSPMRIVCLLDGSAGLLRRSLRLHGDVEDGKGGVDRPHLHDQRRRRRGARGAEELH